MLIFGYRLQLWQCIEPGCLTAPHSGAAPLLGLCLLLRYCNYYAIHGSPYTSAYVLIEGYSTKWPRTYAWCCVARIECLKALTSVMGFMLVPVSMSIVPRLLCYRLTEEEEKLVQNGIFAVFRLATCT